MSESFCLFVCLFVLFLLCFCFLRDCVGGVDTVDLGRRLALCMIG